MQTVCVQGLSYVGSERRMNFIKMHYVKDLKRSSLGKKIDK